MDDLQWEATLRWDKIIRNNDLSQRYIIVDDDTSKVFSLSHSNQSIESKAAMSYMWNDILPAVWHYQSAQLIIESISSKFENLSIVPYVEWFETKVAIRRLITGDQ